MYYVEHCSWWWSWWLTGEMTDDTRLCMNGLWSILLFVNRMTFWNCNVFCYQSLFGIWTITFMLIAIVCYSVSWKWLISWRKLLMMGWMSWLRWMNGFFSPWYWYCYTLLHLLIYFSVFYELESRDNIAIMGMIGIF